MFLYFPVPEKGFKVRGGSVEFAAAAVVVIVVAAVVVAVAVVSLECIFKAA